MGKNRAGRREAEHARGMAQPGHPWATREGEFLPSQGMSHWQRQHGCLQEVISAGWPHLAGAHPTGKWESGEPGGEELAG